MPKDIPDNCYVDHNNNDDIMISKHVTFDSIKACLQYIHDKAYTKQWTHFSNTVQSYASLECVNGALAKQVYESAKNLRKMHIQEEGNVREGSQNINEDLLPGALLSPNLSMDQCMVGIMHTFFLNGGKKILSLVHDVFKKEKSGTFYLTKSKIVFKDIRALSLSWIMAWPFGSTADKPMAPWVSENYVAYYQTCKSHISFVCESLLRKGRIVVADNMKLLLSVWHRLLSVVMQPSTPSSEDIAMVSELSKVFLSRYHEIEKFLERPTKDWDLQNTSCHLMMLILPEYMKKFGCLRNYWEGGHMGERSITKLKKSLPHGAHMDGSVRSAIRRYFVDVVLSQLMETELLRDNNVQSIENGAQYAIDEGDTPFESVLNNNENCTKQSYDRYRRFRVYKSKDSVEAAIQDNKPVALVYLGYTKQFYVLVWESVNNCRERYMNVVNFSAGETNEGTYMVKKESMVNSLQAEDLGNSNNKLVFNYDIVSRATSCVALPYMTAKPNESNVLVSAVHYFIRTEEHLELRGVVDGIPVFSYPTLYIGQ
jgi:hypothetical protein